MKTLNQIQDDLKAVLPHGIDLTIEALKMQLRPGTDKFNDLILLEGRYREIGRKLLQNVISNEESDREFSKIRRDLVEFIDTLQAVWLVETSSPAPDERPDVYNGEVFYRIPDKMQVGHETKCIVRLAFDRQVLTQDIEVNAEDVLKDLRISGVMGVELLDTTGGAFAIPTVHDTVQTVDKDLFTEWVFQVKPILEGVHPLTLKISIIEIKDGIEQRRNVVLEEQVIVVTEPVLAEADQKEKAALAVNVGRPVAPPQPAPSPASPRPLPQAPKGSGGLRKLAPMLAGVAAIVIASWAALQSGLFDRTGPNPPDPSVVVDDTIVDNPAVRVTDTEAWEIAEATGTRQAYEDFRETYPTSSYVVMALIRLDDFAFEDAIAANSKPGYEQYLKDYPAGKHADEARKRLQGLTTKPTKPQGVKPTKPSKPAKPAEPTKPATKPPVTKPGTKPTTPTKPAVDPAIPMSQAARLPIYEGCDNENRKKEVTCTEGKIRDFIKRKLKYPVAARNKEIEGTVNVTFVVEKDGSLTDVQYANDPGGGCGPEAVRLVQAMPKFKPGRDNSSKPVRVKYQLPIRFRLQ